jgi:hypothetical protein
MRFHAVLFVFRITKIFLTYNQIINKKIGYFSNFEQLEIQI